MNRLLTNLENVVKIQTGNEIIHFLEKLQKEDHSINLYGAIVLLKEKYGSSN